MKIGVDIGGTKCAVVLGDETHVEKRVVFPTEDLDTTVENIIAAVAAVGKGDAIGISCGGPLDSKQGLILSPPNLPSWDRVPIAEILSDRFGVPAYLENDANACALAEWRYGAGKGTENMVFLTFGTGLGAGLILGGRLYSGTNGMAGEVGHIRLLDHGPVGYGKAGSLEGFCSGNGLAQIGRELALEQLQVGKTLPYCACHEDLDGINAKTLAEFARAGEPVAAEAFRVCGEMLGRGLSVIVDILNPEAIVIGSVFQRAEDLLRGPMEEVLRRESLTRSREVCRILPAALGDRIGDFAALAVAYDHSL